MKAVRFDEYGGTDVLYIADVPVPDPADGHVLVRVKATSINPGEAKIRDGSLHARWPATFPSGEGSDFAGVVERIGGGVADVAAGDEVIGFSDDRSAHAEYIVVPAEQLTAKPANVPWDVAGALYVIGSTAYASVRAVAPKPGETVAVSGAAGGVGSLTVQLAKRTGANVIGIAGAVNHEWLAAHGVVPIGYGAELADRLRAIGTVDAFIDTYGVGYVQLAVEDLGIDPQRVNTIADFPAIERYGVKGDGNGAASSAAVLAELADLLAKGELEIPIAATYPLTEIRAAYDKLAEGHIRGKIVLLP